MTWHDLVVPLGILMFAFSVISTEIPPTQRKRKPLRWFRKFCGCSACCPKPSIMNSPAMIKALMPTAPPRKPNSSNFTIAYNADGEVRVVGDDEVLPQPTKKQYRTLEIKPGRSYQSEPTQGIYDTKTGALAKGFTIPDSGVKIKSERHPWANRQVFEARVDVDDMLLAMTEPDKMTDVLRDAVQRAERAALDGAAKEAVRRRNAPLTYQEIAATMPAATETADRNAERMVKRNSAMGTLGEFTNTGITNPKLGKWMLNQNNGGRWVQFPPKASEWK